MLKELFESMFHPHEVAAMLKLKFGGRVRSPPVGSLLDIAPNVSDVDFCYAVLHRVSRSFAVVIQHLDDELRDAICIFYLVLRGLDSVEDDMDFPLDQKLPLLRDFYKKLDIDGWNIKDVGDSVDYRHLLQTFEKVIRVYNSLKPLYKTVIRDITREMGAGMASFAEMAAVANPNSPTASASNSSTTSAAAVSALVVPESSSCSTTQQYDLYCHYVAGLVGIGLSRMFSASGLEDANLGTEERISNSCGLFLQKTNIIRDYLEDLHASRTWWPEDIWSRYAPTLDWFAANPEHPNSRACLNHMITNALQHVPDVLTYLSQLKTKSIFEFCAIPQVMAMATLAKLYDNTDVFKGVVKVRKGLSCHMMLNSGSMSQVHKYFNESASEVATRIDVASGEPMAPVALRLAQEVVYLTRDTSTAAVTRSASGSASPVCASDSVATAGQANRNNGVFTWATQATTMCAVVLALWWWK